MNGMELVTLASGSGNSPIRAFNWKMDMAEAC